MESNIDHLTKSVDHLTAHVDRLPTQNWVENRISTRLIKNFQWLVGLEITIIGIIVPVIITYFLNN
ncbi:hypothetical protein ABN16_10070 [Levilactobacillus koreensis]|uniref:Uncharacterized protein n=1 Tax=Levilactobacillus koreensis TaxID=637971 RepID=A0AAC8UVL0_9LACO|nr:hypothetical protein ABN16_10070 [Levilactobacillus koreensis]